MWEYAVIFLLVVLVVLFFVLFFVTKSKNKMNETMNILYPFSGYLLPPNAWNPSKSNTNPGTGKSPADGLFLVGQVGGKSSTVPQIQCPAGYKINIVGAFVEVVDPYGECGSAPPDPTLQLTCGNQNQLSGALCSSDTACGDGMQCVNGRCVAKSCSKSSDCSSSANVCAIWGMPSKNGKCDNGLVDVNGTCQLNPAAGPCMACVDPSTGNEYNQENADGGVCVSMPTCIGVTPNNGTNSVCSVLKDTHRCRPREATAYLAKHCDGKNVCLGNANDKWYPNQSSMDPTHTNPFGPLPCEIPATEANETSDYLNLPIIQGWGGGVPANGTTASPATFNQGYYVHGIYTCVPESEDVQTLSS